MQILLTISYDGTAYAGWQRQQNAIAVQQRLEEALSALLGRPITTKAASRTDAGVHALGQKGSFFVDKINIPLNKLPQVLASYLPGDISVTSAMPVCDCFNPRFDAVYKSYIYNMHSTPNPLINRYSSFVPMPLDIKAMEQAAKAFIGRHDFAAFQATGSSAKTTVREIYNCCIASQPQSQYFSCVNSQPQYAVCTNIHKQITLSITGNGFLYNMVRIIAGTLMYVGLGKITPEQIPEIILSKDRKKAGKTMPPEGLILMEVGYNQYAKN